MVTRVLTAALRALALSAVIGGSALAPAPAQAEPEYRRPLVGHEIQRPATDMRYIPACAVIEAPRPKVSSGCAKTQVCKAADGRVTKTCTAWSIIR